MSWCRWSSMDFQCDLYVYESHDGVEVHVGANRFDIDRDAVPPYVSILDDLDAWHTRHLALQKMLDEADRQPIGLPFDGQHRTFYSLEEAADWIDELVALGYIIPEGMTDDMRSEFHV